MENQTQIQKIVHKSPFYYAGRIEAIVQESFGTEERLSKEAVDEIVEAIINAKYSVSWEEITTYFRGRNKPIKIG